MTTDPRIAPLTAALPARLFVALMPEERDDERREIAAAILAALDATPAMLWDDLSYQAGLEDGRTAQQAEIARLRAIEAEALTADTTGWGPNVIREHERARIATVHNEHLAEIARLTDELSGCNSGVLDLLATNARLRKIEKAARASLAAGDPPAGWSARKRADDALRAAIEEAKAVTG